MLTVLGERVELDGHHVATLTAAVAKENTLRWRVLDVLDAGAEGREAIEDARDAAHEKDMREQEESLDEALDARDDARNDAARLRNALSEAIAHMPEGLAREAAVEALND